jgi:hypothetical protein
VRRRSRQSSLAAAAQLVEPERRQRSDQHEAAHQRVEQRQDRIAESEPRQHQADDRIDHAEEHGVRRHRHKIVDTLGECVFEIGKADTPNGRMRRTDAGAEQDMRMCHDGLLKPGVQVDAARAEMTRNLSPAPVVPTSHE